MIPDNKTPDAVAYDAIESSLDDFVRWLDLFPDRDVLDYQWPQPPPGTTSKAETYRGRVN